MRPASPAAPSSSLPMVLMVPQPVSHAAHSAMTNHLNTFLNMHVSFEYALSMVLMCMDHAEIKP
jgi:hypothetical protein